MATTSPRWRRRHEHAAGLMRGVFATVVSLALTLCLLPRCSEAQQASANGQPWVAGTRKAIGAPASTNDLPEGRVGRVDGLDGVAPQALPTFHRILVVTALGTFRQRVDFGRVAPA